MFVRKTIVLLALALVGISATTTCAEISESDQERAAQRAYDASRQEYEDVGRDAQRDRMRSVSRSRPGNGWAAARVLFSTRPAASPATRGLYPRLTRAETRSRRTSGVPPAAGMRSEAPPAALRRPAARC